MITPEQLQRETRRRPAEVGDKHPDAKGQANRLLESLIGRGWRTTQDLVEEVGHRFSTSVQYLRDRGHVIDKRSGEGRQYEYCYVTFYDVVRADSDWQERYYASPHWRAKREERLEQDHYACCWCGATSGLHVHHWRYDLFEERTSDLMTLCSVCHERIHRYDSVRASFPKQIRKELYERLTPATEAPEPECSGEIDDPPPDGMLFAVDDPDTYHYD